jgi:hypothetical protein
LNAGPWLRLDHDRPFIGTTPKPAGGGFYPTDMTKEEFEVAVAADPDQKTAMTGYFTRIERAPEGKLIPVPYSDAYGAQLREAAKNLNDAADILTAETTKSQLANGVDYTTLAAFLRSRAAAFTSNDYFQSDMDWMDIKDNILDVTMGPYEVYEDALFNYKASFEAVIAMRNPTDSKKLDELKHYLPAMERNLPIENQYKTSAATWARVCTRSRTTCPMTSACARRRVPRKSCSRTSRAPSTTRFFCRSLTSCWIRPR